MKRNVFQRLDDGNKLWHDLVDAGYDDWITVEQYANLKKCFQQRHLLQHQDGIIDQDYLNRSGDARYAIGQRLIISTDDVLSYADIVETLGERILALVQEDSSR